MSLMGESVLFFDVELSSPLGLADGIQLAAL